MYLQPTDASIQATMARLPREGGFVMLNLFRLHDKPDYSRHPEMDAGAGASSRELFLRYIAEMDVFLRRYGIERMFLGTGGAELIGPEGERWDIVQMVRYPSLQAFGGLSTDQDVMAHVPLREVSVSDSRVMAMVEEPLGAASLGAH